MIIYIAGPITGVPEYKQTFAEAEEKLTEEGNVVINPALLPEGLGDCDTYMKICFPMIAVADAIVMLKDWQNSRGACREWGFARGLGKEIIEYKAFMK